MANMTGAEFLATLPLTPVQLAFASSPERFLFMKGGPRTGKTYAAAARTIAYALDHPGGRVMVCTPVYAPPSNGATSMVLRMLPRSLVRISRSTGMHCDTTLHNGSEILFRAATSIELLRGIILTAFWLDQADIAGYYTWEVLRAAIHRERERPTSAWATGHDYGRDTKFFLDFGGPPRPGHEVVMAEEYSAHYVEE